MVFILNSILASNTHRRNVQCFQTCGAGSDEIHSPQHGTERYPSGIYSSFFCRWITLLSMNTRKKSDYVVLHQILASFPLVSRLCWPGFPKYLFLEWQALFSMLLPTQTKNRAAQHGYLLMMVPCSWFQRKNLSKVFTRWLMTGQTQFARMCFVCPIITIYLVTYFRR